MGIWNKMNRSKRSLAVDAKDPGGDDVLHRLVESTSCCTTIAARRRSLGIAAASRRRTPRS